MRQEGSGIEAAICRSRMAATIACLICACSVCPESAEILNKPDQMAVSFRCDMTVILGPSWPCHFYAWTKALRQ
jgi:hypothetical protein